MIQRQFTLIYESEKQAINFWCADKVLLVITFGWVIFCAVYFQSISLRPTELYTPNNWFTRLFCSTFPSNQIFLFFCAFTSLIILLLIFKFSDNILLRILLLFNILWLDGVIFSFGHLSHVTHVLILSHLFKIFIPTNIATNIKSGEVFIKMQKLSYTGILLTYSMAGGEKLFRLILNIFLQNQELNWLNPKAAYVNAIVSYRDYDNGFDSWVFIFLELGFPAQIGFIFILIVQLGAVLAAFYNKIRFPWAILLILFHVMTIVLFRINFFLAPIVLLAVFFPYSNYSNFSRTIKNLSSKM